MAQQILLNAFDMNCVGHQSCGLWRHPRDRSSQYTNISYWQELARTLERGLFDAVFLADVSGVYDVYQQSPDAALRGAIQVPANDPFTLVGIMAAVTEHLCFGVTGSIPYEPPYAFARRLSSLDHLTNGRMGWNIVTGYLDSAARGVGQQRQTGHDTRYEIAEEYMQVVYPLWEGSWDDDAVVRDADQGIYTDPARVREVHHSGEYFELHAMHLCEPSPQRTPVLFQAGSSDKGQAFAAQHAECVFTGNPAATAALREQAEAAGRSGDALKVFAMTSVVTAETDAEAQAKYEDYQRYGLRDGALALLSGWSGVDYAIYDHQDIPGARKTEAIQASRNLVQEKTVGEIADDLAVGGAAPVLVGSPTTVADKMQALIEATGVDGFNLAYTVMPECMTDFVDLVVPELQRRGAYKTGYAPGTFRDKLFSAGPRLADNHPAAAYRPG